MKKLLKNPTYVNKTGYNGLDLSHVVDFTSSVGHVVPVMWDFLQPGDKVKLQDSLLTRTSPLLSSAFATIEENVRYFFVPISQIYKPFEQLYNGIQDFGSDFYQPIVDRTTISSDLLPRVQLAQIVSFMYRNPSEVCEDIVRLLEGIGVPMYKILSLLTNGDTSYLTHQVNVFPLLAYQKIWFDFFRDTDRIENDPSFYNCDSFVEVAKMNDIESLGSRLAKWLQVGNCPVMKDVKSNVFVSPLFGQTDPSSSHVDTLLRVNQWLSGLSKTATATPENVVGDGSPYNTSVRPTTTYPLISPNALTANTLNTANLRAAFATEKLLEITRRAAKHYDAQILAHFGVDVPTGVDGECFELGLHTQRLEIGAVLSTADTYNSSDDSGVPLGEIGGKAYQHDTGMKFTFEAKTHGILMAVYYARPKFVYEEDGINKKLAYTRVSDFPRPEYDDLGMQPRFRMNDDLTSVSSSNSEIDSYEYRYSEVKGMYDRAINGMRRTLNNWVVSRNGLFKDSEDFYVDKYAINQILVVPYSPSSEDPRDARGMVAFNESLFDTDPLYHQLSFSYQKATKLSTYGLPTL